MRILKLIPVALLCAATLSVAPAQAMPIAPQAAAAPAPALASVDAGANGLCDRVPWLPWCNA